jgi:hypothetical protein
MAEDAAENNYENDDVDSETSSFYDYEEEFELGDLVEIHNENNPTEWKKKIIITDFTNGNTFVSSYTTNEITYKLLLEVWFQKVFESGYFIIRKTNDQPFVKSDTLFSVLIIYERMN